MLFVQKKEPLNVPGVCSWFTSSMFLEVIDQSCHNTSASGSLSLETNVIDAYVLHCHDYKIQPELQCQKHLWTVVIPSASFIHASLCGWLRGCAIQCYLIRSCSRIRFKCTFPKGNCSILLLTWFSSIFSVHYVGGTESTGRTDLSQKSRTMFMWSQLSRLYIIVTIHA